MPQVNAGRDNRPAASPDDNTTNAVADAGRTATFCRWKAIHGSCAPFTRFRVPRYNRDNSEDSRYRGFVGRESIRGRPLLVCFSFMQPAPDHDSWTSRVRWRRIGHAVH